MPEVLEQLDWEFTAGGVTFRLEEFTSLQRRRYARKIIELSEKAKGAAESEIARSMGAGEALDLAAISESVLDGEEEFLAWILNLGTTEEISAAWVGEHVKPSMQRRILARLDEINLIGEHLGNVAGRLRLAEAARTVKPSGSESSTR